MREYKYTKHQSLPNLDYLFNHHVFLKPFEIFYCAFIEILHFPRINSTRNVGTYCICKYVKYDYKNICDWIAYQLRHIKCEKIYYSLI